MNLKITNMNPDEADHMNFKQKFDNETNNFLDILDPYQTDKIPLSDVVKLFSNQMVDDKKNKTMLLSNSVNYDLPLENYSPSPVNVIDRIQKAPDVIHPYLDSTDPQFEHSNKYTPMPS